MKCDNCGKPAKYNLQNWWHLYEIIPNQIVDEEINDWEGDENLYYCEKCAIEESVIVE